jgi:hypothetical protein
MAAEACRQITSIFAFILACSRAWQENADLSYAVASAAHHSQNAAEQLLLTAGLCAAHLACCTEHHRVCDDLVCDRVFELILLCDSSTHLQLWVVPLTGQHDS